MTDHQFDAILDMVDMILDGCKSVKEAQEKLRSIRKRSGLFSEKDTSEIAQAVEQTESERTKVSFEAHESVGSGADR